VVATLLYSAVLAALPLPARPQQATATTEMLIRLSLQPMPAPKPALRYLLLPELKEMTPGNPIPNYLKCILDQDFTSDQETISRAALRQADRAARMDKPDWQILPRVKTDGINLLLPDVQKMRTLANSLQGRFREEIAQGRIDDALVTAKTMFAMARHMSEHPTIIGDLVGFALATITIAPLEELLEQPGCPNLYWALTNLPCPLVPMDRGLEGERMFMLAELKDLDETAPMTAGQIDKVIKHIDYLRKFEPDKNVLTTRAWVNLRARNEKHVAAARRRLVEYGLAEERVAKFPAEQVILLDERREYEVRRDDEEKLMNLPTWEFVARSSRSRPPRPGQEPSLFDFFLPSLFKIRLAQGRLEQRIALLRHVEALRMHAAEHGGAWPAKLADVGVPLPLDPFTGKPFRYEVSGETAHLRGNPPPGEEKTPVYNLHYELTLRKGER
jgi:hypothetical protein